MSEGTLQQVWETLAQAWWNKSLDVLMTENNSNVVRAAVQTAIASGLSPTAENWQKVVSKFAARLQVDTPRQPVNPEDAEIEQLLQKYPECTSVERWTEYIKTRGGKLRGEEVHNLNKLGAHLQKHNVRDKATINEAPEVKASREAYSEANRLANGLSVRDLGSRRTARPQLDHDKIFKERNRLTRYLKEAKARAVNGETALQYVREQIAILGDAGIQ